MKKFAIALTAMMALAACCAGCNGGNPPEGETGKPTPLPDPPSPPVEEEWLEYRKYDLKTYLTPFWEGEKVYNETLWFAGEDGLFAPLMYEPDEIAAVMSYDLKTVYKEGVDYIFEKGSKELVLTEESAIPHMTHDEYYLKSPNNSVPVPCLKGGFLYFSEGPDISMRQVAVTYRHTDEAHWKLPRVESARFPRTFEKLERGEEIKVLFYGDSITVGANSSGFSGVDIAPHAETYPEMVRSYLRARYPAATVLYENTAAGGTDSFWGAGVAGGAAGGIEAAEGDHFAVRVLDKDPDLLFIAFGMNDGPSVTSYKTNIRTMISRVREKNPDVEIMLVSSMNANEESAFYNKDFGAFEDALIELSEEFGVGVATVYSTVSSLYDMGKRFRDWTGNDANHPNDFMARVYAQTIVYSLFGADYIEHI